ncbi:TPA: hypothetical protein N0F65_011843 [Lagenidium giganteum]|uniref:RNase H type-1 domain-containing protein n=1 Tax=Lagenidium giganteum TaxID=4803 RepID=A0AAV2YY40_9STRA|nr:TPA: hypothetical protein N0F65_011843 [Lagenidium giganteum]
MLQALFLEDAPPTPSPSTPSSGQWILFFDGASRGNPGPAGAGAILVHVSATQSSVIWAVSAYLGVKTNNEAEYTALIQGLSYCRSRGINCLLIVGDSRFVLDALRAGRRPRHPRLIPFFQIAHVLRASLRECIWRHHRRSYNRMADALANWALDHAQSQVFQPPPVVPSSVLKALSSDIGAATLLRDTTE